MILRSAQLTLAVLAFIFDLTPMYMLQQLDGAGPPVVYPRPPDNHALRHHRKASQHGYFVFF